MGVSTEVLFQEGNIVAFTEKALSGKCVGLRGRYYRVISVSMVDPRFLKGNGHHPQRVEVVLLKKEKGGFVDTKSASINVSGVLVERAVMKEN